MRKPFPSRILQNSVKKNCVFFNCRREGGLWFSLGWKSKRRFQKKSHEEENKKSGIKKRRRRRIRRSRHRYLWPWNMKSTTATTSTTPATTTTTTTATNNGGHRCDPQKEVLRKKKKKKKKKKKSKKKKKKKKKKRLGFHWNGPQWRSPSPTFHATHDPRPALFFLSPAAIFVFFSSLFETFVRPTF